MSDAPFWTQEGIPVPAVTAGQMREVDRIAVEELGLGILQMMENAGRNLAQDVIQTLGRLGGEVTILAGAGGNGSSSSCRQQGYRRCPRPRSRRRSAGPASSSMPSSAIACVGRRVVAQPSSSTRAMPSGTIANMPHRCFPWTYHRASTPRPVKHGVPWCVLSAIHVYPSYSVAGQQAAAAIRIDRLLSGTTGRVVRGLAHLIR